jgi:sugar phosphate isomerase/epimerase
MTTCLTRRGFLGAGIAGAGAAALGTTPEASAATAVVREVKGPRLKLSLAAYSFNRLLPREASPRMIEKAKMRIEDFVRFCAEQNLGACEPTSYYFPKDPTPEYLNGFKALCFRLGLDISGTAIGNDFCVPEGAKRDDELARTRQWIDNAAIIGAPVIRIFAGNVPKGDTEEAALERCVAGINESLEYAAKKGVFLALENHGGITATPEQLLRIVEAVNPSPWFGINFDSGNFRTADPYGDLEKIAPHAVNAQVKVSIRPDGGDKQRGDFKRIIDILKGAGYRGYVALEYEEEEDPFTAIPPLLDELRPLVEG